MIGQIGLFLSLWHDPCRFWRVSLNGWDTAKRTDMLTFRAQTDASLSHDELTSHPKYKCNAPSRVDLEELGANWMVPFKTTWLSWKLPLPWRIALASQDTRSSPSSGLEGSLKAECNVKLALEPDNSPSFFHGKITTFFTHLHGAIHLNPIASIEWPGDKNSWWPQFQKKRRPIFAPLFFGPHLESSVGNSTYDAKKYKKHDDDL